MHNHLYAADPDHFLRRHLASLDRLRHSLSEIIVVLNEDGDTPLNLPASIGGCPVRGLKRPNHGLSYGAFAYGVEHAQSEYLILMEDDYVFTGDDFDRILLEKIRAQPRPGFVCGAVEYAGASPLGASVFLGIADTQATRDVLTFGYDDASITRTDNTRATGWYSQVAWSRSYASVGRDLSDWIDQEWSCLTWVTESTSGIWYDVNNRPGAHSSKRASSPISPRITSSRGVVVVGRRSTQRQNVAVKPTRARMHIPVFCSLVLPQQAIDAGRITMKIGDVSEQVLVRDDGRVVQIF